MKMYCIYPDVRVYGPECFCAYSPHDVYHLLMSRGYDHEEAASAEGWCELAAVGETYEHGECYIDVVDSV